MNHTSDATAAGNGDTFNPEQAAALLDQTRQQARRQLEPTPPWALATRAVMVVAALGAIWLSVRGQHPYRGPTTADIPVLVAFIVINFGLTVAVRHRAMAGVRGGSRLRPAEIAVAALGWVGTVVFMATLEAAGVSYGHYPTTVLILPGLAWAGVMAARKNRGGCATGLAVTVIGVTGLFAGPAGSWAVAAVGLCALLLGHAAAVAWRQHA
jgi:hypothetical protein